MTTINPLPIWLHSDSPAAMVELIGGVDGPQREALERCVTALESQWRQNSNMPSGDGENYDLNRWLEYFHMTNDFTNLLKASEGCSLLRCCVPPPRTCPECDGSKRHGPYQSSYYYTGDGRRLVRTEQSPCSKCSATGIICEPPAIDPCWLSSTVCDLVEQIADGATNADGQDISRGLYLFLHDALMDAGCDDEAILRHCLDEMHCGECWLVELLKGARR